MSIYQSRVTTLTEINENVRSSLVTNVIIFFHAFLKNFKLLNIFELDELRTENKNLEIILEDLHIK